MTDMIHHFLKVAWEEVQVKERKWMDPPALVGTKPDVAGMIADIQNGKYKEKTNETPAEKIARNNAASKAAQKKRKTEKRKTKATAAA